LVRTGRRGLSAGRNDGVERAPGDVIIFTDDDCLVRTGWIESWCRAFEEDSTLGIGFGPVEAPPFDAEAGHTPTFTVNELRSCHDLRVFKRGVEAVGMGANMALRRNAWVDAGGFDEALGAGRELAGAEETDIAYRILRRGSRLVHLMGPAVIHYGFRPTAEASRLCRGYAAGTGAMYAKHLRCGDLYAGSLLARDTARMVGKSLGRLARREMPLGAGALMFYCRGAAASWRLQIDRDHRRFCVNDTS
jgi:GT2 family glycosyltransferase